MQHTHHMFQKCIAYIIYVSYKCVIYASYMYQLCVIYVSYMYHICNYVSYVLYMSYRRSKHMCFINQSRHQVRIISLHIAPYRYTLLPPASNRTTQHNEPTFRTPRCTAQQRQHDLKPKYAFRRDESSIRRRAPENLLDRFDPGRELN